MKTPAVKPQSNKPKSRVFTLIGGIFGKKNISASTAEQEFEFILTDMRAKVFFGAIFFVLGLLMIMLLWPYASAGILAVLVAVILHPLYKWLKAKLGWSPRMITTLMLVGMLIMSIIPLIVLLTSVVTEAINTSKSINTYIASGEVSELSSRAQYIAQKANINVGALDVAGLTVQALEKFSSQLAGYATMLVKNIFSFFVALSVFFATLVFLIPRMSKIKRTVLEISPLGREITHSYIEKTRLLLRGAVVGSFLISITSATIMGITFWALGIPNALLFAALAFVLGFIPFLGTPIFTFAAAGVSLLLGNYVDAAILVGVQLVVLNQLDLVFRPISVPKKVRINPALMIVAVLSGLAAFGVLGIIFGPTILVLFMSSVEIYKKNYAKPTGQK